MKLPKELLSKTTFLKPILKFYIIALSITTLSRIFLTLFFWERVTGTPNFWHLFFIGIRMDIILLTYIASLPTILLIFLPNSILKRLNGFIRYFLAICLFFLVFMEIATPTFLLQYDTRPNRLFVEYLLYPKEVSNMLVKGFGIQLLLAFIVLILAAIFLFKKSKRWLSLGEEVSYTSKLLLFPIIGFLLFWGARSSLTSVRPINASNAIFSKDQFTNSLALSSLYTVSFAIYSLKNEEDSSKMYGKMDEKEAIDRTRKYMSAVSSDFTNDEIPLLHEQKSTHKTDKPYNLVIFLQESLGAEYVGCLNGLPLTPNIDKLSKEGMLFTNLYCTGTRSVRGIEAVVTGFLPTPSRSVVKLGKAQNGFFTLADVLGKKGYETSFIYGGLSNFDNMASFFNGNGFKKIIDENDFKKDEYAFKGVWGVSDEDLVAKANDLYKSYGDTPFFSLMFSSSNHTPFEFPDGRIDLYDKEKNTVNNAIKYADYAIGKFFEMAKKEAYYDNTVFVVIADHNTRTYGKNLIPVHKFHIPAFIIAPGIEGGVNYEKLCSQIDIPPTLLDLTGLDVQTPMPGRNLFDLKDDVPGRAIMQFHTTNAFRVGNEMVVLQPNKEPVQFEINGDENLKEKQVDPELAKDALGHIITASSMYKKGTYKLPEN